ncbi:MAG: hypothetical protein QOG74_798, partial [Alphaproteobacteria bacterium]|nr:hypothetical protein [Alphaproteobacteria bacterium]
MSDRSLLVSPSPGPSRSIFLAATLVLAV